MTDNQEQLEPAIPAHLVEERTLPLGCPLDFQQPKYALHSARFDLPSRTDPAAAIDTIKSGITSTFGPEFHDQARYTDGAGYMNIVFVLYWRDQQRYENWKNSLALDWWHAGLSIDGHIGAFQEVYTPSVRDTETVFTQPVAEGYTKLADHISGKIDTHDYWGSARDRIPRAQTDALLPEGRLRLASMPLPDDTRGHRLVVEPHDNLCLLRSGQDWIDTLGDERALYLDNVKPVLEVGMAEIADDGLSRGCYFNRYMTIEGDNGPVEKTYSVSAWHSLGELESWVKTKTHLKIFGAGIQYLQQVGENSKLRLYHEMMVLKANNQSYTYFNCHPQTGMLRAVTSEMRSTTSS